MRALHSSAQVGCRGWHQAQRRAGAAPCGIRGTSILSVEANVSGSLRISRDSITSKIRAVLGADTHGELNWPCAKEAKKTLAYFRCKHFFWLRTLRATLPAGCGAFNFDQIYFFFKISGCKFVLVSVGVVFRGAALTRQSGNSLSSRKRVFQPISVRAHVFKSAMQAVLACTRTLDTRCSVRFR